MLVLLLVVQVEWITGMLEVVMIGVFHVCQAAVIAFC